MLLKHLQWFDGVWAQGSFGPWKAPWSAKQLFACRIPHWTCGDISEAWPDLVGPQFFLGHSPYYEMQHLCLRQRLLAGNEDVSSLLKKINSGEYPGISLQALGIRSLVTSRARLLSLSNPFLASWMHLASTVSCGCNVVIHGVKQHFPGFILNPPTDHFIEKPISSGLHKHSSKLN